MLDTRSPGPNSGLRPAFHYRAADADRKAFCCSSTYSVRSLLWNSVSFKFALSVVYPASLSCLRTQRLGLQIFEEIAMLPMCISWRVLLNTWRLGIQPVDTSFRRSL